MSLSYGFYNSVDHDRRYDAKQFSRLIDCLIKDGIFMHIGDKMMVTAHEDHIEIGSGLAWFNSTWSYNDTPYMIALPKSDVVYTRIDAVVLEVYEEESIRANFFKIVEGTPALNPVKPDLLNIDNIHQHPLCYITRPANNELVYQSAIENAVGTNMTPFVSGILETVEASALLAQWEAEFEEWMNSEETSFEEWSNLQRVEYGSWQEQMDAVFHNWFNDLQDTLSGDVAGKLAVQIEKEERDRIFTSGFADGTKTISEDGRTVLTVASDGRQLLKVFSQDFKTLTSTIKDKDGGDIVSQVKVFSDDGRVIQTDIIL